MPHQHLVSFLRHDPTSGAGGQQHNLLGGANAARPFSSELAVVLIIYGCV